MSASVSDTFVANVTISGSTSSVTATFRALISGAKRSRDGATSIRHSPYGNYNIVQLGGRNIVKRSLRVYVADDTNAGYLEELVNAQGTLTYGEGTFTAVLDSIDREQWIASNQQIFITNWLINVTPD